MAGVAEILQDLMRIENFSSISNLGPGFDALSAYVSAFLVKAEESPRPW